MAKNLKVFIGSSTEGAAQSTQDGVQLLDKIAEWIEAKGHTPLRWNDPTAFPPGEFTLQSLVRIAQTVDAAVFILSDDEKGSFRGSDVKMPRDNVLIEYGLFMGALGEQNVIAGSRGEPKLASDLAGLTLVDLSDNRLIRAENKVERWLDEVEQRVLDSERHVEITLTEHPYVELIATTADRRDATVHAINALGKQLYGYRDAVDLVGEHAKVLPERLKRWIDPPSVRWDDLDKDQARVYEQFYRGDRASASIPVQFNDSHPFFADKSFIPIIVQQRTKKGSPGREITGVLYLDVATLPRALFLERVWDQVSKSLNLDGLVDEIKVIEKEVQRPAPNFTGGKSEGPPLLAYFAEIGLYQAYGIARTNGLVQVKHLLSELLSMMPESAAAAS